MTPDFQQAVEAAKEPPMASDSDRTWCREFVVKCQKINILSGEFDGMKHTEEELTAELTALFADRGTGDESVKYWADRIAEGTAGMPVDCDHEFIGYYGKCEHCGYNAVEVGAVKLARHVLDAGAKTIMTQWHDETEFHVAVWWPIKGHEDRGEYGGATVCGTIAEANEARQRTIKFGYPADRVHIRKVTQKRIEPAGIPTEQP